MEDFEYDVFISYKTEEVAFAKEVYEALSSRYTVFFSERTLHHQASDDFEESIKEALRSSLILLNVGMSAECLSGEWLKKEREYFLPLRDFSNKKRRVFNIVSNNFDIKNDLPKDLEVWNTRMYPSAKEEIFGLIQNAREQNSSVIADFALTNKPDKLMEQYEKDVFRKRSFSVMSDYFSGLEDSVGMLYIHGSAGVGKSSFMSKAFNAYEKNLDRKYIYYITGDDDVSEHLDRISEVLSKRFKSIARHNDLKIGFKDILEIADPSTKIDKLFYLYSKKIYRKTKLSFTLFVDAVDTLNDERKFMRTLVQNYQGIHFVFSGRVVPEDEFLLKIKQENIDIFKEESSAGLHLDNLEDSLTFEYLGQNLDPERKLSKKQRQTIQEKIVMKSRGLPKYFEILLSKVNTLAQEDDEIFMQMVMEIDSAPEELTEYYIQIFKIIEKENPLAMKILEILYWYRDMGIDKIILAELLNMNFGSELNEVLYPIDFLIKTVENTHVALNHLSISEALFNYYAFTNGTRTARKLDIGYMQDIFEKDPILFYLAKYNSDIYTLLNSVYYFDEDNILLIALSNIVDFNINKSLMKNDRPLNLYFIYSKILFARHMLKKDILQEGMCATEIFTTSDTSVKAVALFNEKVYRQYIGRELDNVFDLRKIVYMTVLDQNTYYQSKYLKKYFEFTYAEKYKKIFALEQLSKISLEGLTSNLSRTYVAMRYKLTGKALDPKLGIYHDESLVMLYDETKSPNKNKKVIDTIIQAQQQKKERPFLEKQKRYYDIIKTASDLKVKKYFYNNIYFYAKKNQKLDSYTKDFLNEIAVDMLLSDIENLDKNDNFYKYLPVEKKQEINHIFNYYLSYINNGLASLLKPKNINDFKRIVVFIKDEDIATFLVYMNDIFDNTDGKSRTLFMHIVSETVRYSRDREVLLLCKDYIKEFLDWVGDTPVMVLLLILYKLNDLEGLKNLEKIVVRQEYQKEERSIIQQLVGSIDNGLDKYWDILSKRKVSSLENNLKNYFQKGNYDLHEIEFFKSYILKDESIYEKIIKSSYTICDVNKLKYLFLFLQKNNLFKGQDKSIFALNIEVLDNVESFIKHIQTFDVDFQIVFLTKLMTPDKTNLILNEPLMKFILKLIHAHTVLKGTSKLLGGFYFHEPFYLFSKKYPELLRTAYKAIQTTGTKEEIEVKSMLYRNILAIKGEESYALLHEKMWIPEDQKLKIAASLIFLTKKEANAIALGEFLNNETVNELDRIKIQIYIGVVFKNNVILDEGIKALVVMRDSLSEWHQNKYHNYLSFTLSHLLKLDVSKLISNLFTIYNFNYYHVNHFLNANTFLSTGKYKVSLVSNPGVFTSYYTCFNELQQRLDINDLTEGWLANDFDNYMMILYDLYKEAEIQDNEEDHNYYTALFSTLKEEKKSLFEERFNELSSLTLDNYFENKIEKDIFSLDTLKNDYSVFYTYIVKLLEDNNEVKFNDLMEEIKNNEEYFDILKEKSSIGSKLQMKAINISYFEQT